jgi:predicted transcriptional regulator
MAAPFSIRLDDDLKQRLETVAKEDERSVSYVVQKAVTRYLDDRDYEREENKRAYDEMMRETEFISGEAMLAWVRSWGTENELDPPEPDIKLGRSPRAD